MLAPSDTRSVLLQRLDSAIRDRLAPRVEMPMIFIVIGPVHSGKTTGLFALVSELAERGRRCAGVLSRAVFQDGQRIGYDLVNVATKETMPLIRLVGCELWPPEEQIRFGDYSFSLSSFEEGNRVLRNIAQCDAVVIDEVGHLELRGQGFAQGVRYALNQLLCPIVLIVRESLLSDVVSHFEIRSYKAVSVTDGTLLSRLLAVRELSCGD